MQLRNKKYFESVFTDKVEYSSVCVCVCVCVCDVYVYVWQLEQSVRCAGNVEVWLGELLMQQMRALHSIIRLASQFINDQEFQLLAFINESIAQVAVTILFQFITYASRKQTRVGVHLSVCLPDVASTHFSAGCMKADADLLRYAASVVSRMTLSGMLETRKPLFEVAPTNLSSLSSFISRFHKKLYPQMYCWQTANTNVHVD